MRNSRLGMLTAGLAAVALMHPAEPIYPRLNKKRYKAPKIKTNIGRDNKQFKIKGIRP